MSDDMPWEAIREVADKWRNAIKCKTCGGLPVGSTFVGDVCSCAEDGDDDDFADDEIDVTILYCQGCGSCQPDDGSTCPPSCAVQLFPRT